MDKPKYTYTPEIQRQLAEVEPMVCKPTSCPALLASIHYSMAVMFQSDIDRKYATNGADWPQLRDKNLAKAKHYWEQIS